MSLWQAVKGAQVELAATPGPVQKARRLGSIAKLFAAEVLGSIALAPYAARAIILYRSLPAPGSFDAEQQHAVYLAKGLQYGAGACNKMDIYMPVEAVMRQHQGNQTADKLPVVMFVHGGVWAAGERWHYAPMATCLARLGIIACVVQYTLYPSALVPQLVEEMSAAFDWAMAHVPLYGGDVQQVSLVGHSAGAQLCMMALLQRAKAAYEQTAQQGQQQPITQQQHSQSQLAQQPDSHNQEHTAQQQATNGAAQHDSGHTMQQTNGRYPAMPRQFVAVTGVYDIAKHYAYEKERGVHELSTMKRAMGGFEGFAAMSPAVILGAALQQQQQQQQQQQATLQQQYDQQPGQHNVLGKNWPKQQQQQPGQAAAAPVLDATGQSEPPACRYYHQFALSGDSIAHRIGFERSSDHDQMAEKQRQLDSLMGMTGVMQFPFKAAEYLPPTLLVSSCTDLTVPW
eukprot:GHRR01017162.1.p1 GENE.GHRR01017162.1~~GHRR01017162.1.p1  ORF type:complete len:456 (+),score=198.25 GHRR01017162.1:3022-4389(+)